MDKETLYAENKALRQMNQRLSDRIDRMEKALCAVLDAEDLDVCKDMIREEVSK